MENNTEPYAFDLNLDFLDSETPNIKNATLVQGYPGQSQIHSTYDIEAFAGRIANINEIVIQLKETKDDNLKLQKQMQELSESAMAIRSMYDQEKSERMKLKKLNRELQENCERIEAQLANKTLNFEQIQSQMELEAETKKTLPYSDLALKYHRLALQLDEEKHLPAKERIFLQLIKDYLESKNLSPLPCFKKKGSSCVKLENRDFAMQYNFKVETKSQETHCSLGYSKEEPKDTCTQGTQYTWYTTTRGTNTPALNNAKPEVTTQGTQYISSTTTRGTSTSTFIKTQSVGTNFPEPVPPVSIEDIFKEMICNVSPLSPITVNSKDELKEEKVETKTIGTCTDLKNVRKPIDYIVAHIKHSDSRPPSRDNNYDRVKNEIPLMGMPNFNPFAGLGIPVTPMHNNVTELWNMLGHTIFALLQQNSAAAAAQMNVINDRMRNLSGRNGPPSNQQRNCEAHAREDFFGQDFPREFSASTRSVATSPIPPAELHENPFLPMIPSYQPVDLKKIVLNSNFSDSVVSSSRKSSQVDEILQLFPEYTDSFKKRKAIKRLLRKADQNKKPKKSNSISSSSSIAESIEFTSNLKATSTTSSASNSSSTRMDSFDLLQAQSNLQDNWKTKLFSDYDTDSSMDSYFNNSTPEPESQEKWRPTETNQTPNHVELSKLPRGKSPIEEELLGFKEKNYSAVTSGIFCKPDLPIKRQLLVKPSESCAWLLKKHVNGISNKMSPSDESQSTISPRNTKRKRKSRKAGSKHEINKIQKLDKTSFPVNSKTTTEAKNPKVSLSPNRTKANKKSILSIQKETSSDFQNCKPQATQRVSSFHKPDWMNKNYDSNVEDITSNKVSQNNHGPMVMKVEKPPDSVFENIKTCFSNNKQDSKVQDIKTCLITPKLEHNIKPSINTVKPNQAPTNGSEHLAKQSIPFVGKKEDETYRFVIQNNQSTNKPINIPNILHCYENIPSTTTNSSITVLNEEWIPQPNNFNGTELKSASIADANQQIDTNAIDVENIPIYFLDDQIKVRNLEILDEGNLSTKPLDGISDQCQNLTILPGFATIPKELKNSSSKANLQKSDETQFKQQYNFCEENSVKFRNTAKSASTVEDVKSLKSCVQSTTSCIVQNYQQQQNSYNENTISNRVKEDIKILPSHNYSKNGDQFASEGSRLKEDLSKESNMLINETELAITNEENYSSKFILEAPTSSFNSLTTINDNNKKQIQSSAKILNSKLATNSISKEINSSSHQNEKQLNIPVIVPTMSRDYVSSSDHSDNEGNLSIDTSSQSSQSPKSTNTSLFDLSEILKTPERSVNLKKQFKTPDIDVQNDSIINKAITSSTEKLVEEYLLNESPGKEGPKFQIFLDRILEDVAPPLSPISALGSSKKPNETDTEADFPVVPRKYKRKAPATAALAVKRCTRSSTRKIESITNKISNFSSISIPNIELGKYTKRKTETELNKQNKLVQPENQEKIEIKMGFFQETMTEENEDDDEPSCEPIGRYPETDFELINKNNKEENSPKTKLKTEITESHNNPSCLVSCLNVYNKAEEPQVLNDKSEQYVDKNLESLSFYDEPPASPPLIEQIPNPTHTIRVSFESANPSKRDVNSNQRTFISNLIANYNSKLHNTADKGQEFNEILLELQDCINDFLKCGCHPLAVDGFVDSVLKLTSKGEAVARALVNLVKKTPRPETQVTGPFSDIILSQSLGKLLAVLRHLCQHYPSLYLDIQTAIEHTMFTFSKEIIPIEVLLNLTQFYLAVINNPSMGPNPARLFICKCLYFFNAKAVPMIYHTLCAYPTVLPKKQDTIYDRSDIIISAIQSILMSTYYDPEKSDFMSKEMVAKLRLFYKYENFKPPRDEVIENIMAKIRAGRSKNVSYALAIICKRIDQTQTEKFILNERLMPLANEFYHTLNQTTENDEKIACVLECISFVIKPFDVNTDVSHYFNLFGRFLNAASNRKVVQEAAVAAILRMSRFGYVQCFNAVYNYKPTYELSWDLRLMLRSFVYKKGKNFLRTLERQAQELLTA